MKLVVRDRIELSTFRFSGVADVQLRLDVRGYAPVHGCLGALMVAAVAVTVAVGDVSGPSASRPESQAPRSLRWRWSLPPIIVFPLVVNSEGLK
jgi:hypothetical protein